MTEEDVKQAGAQEAPEESLPEASPVPEDQAPEEQVCEAADEACGCEGADELQKTIAALTEDNERMKDLYLRSAAELKNQMARNADALDKARKFALESFAKNLIPVMDSMEKAVQAAQDADEATRLGIEATYRQLLSALERSGVTSLDPKGEKFDPNLHQALVMAQAPEEAESGTVTEVFQKGWVLNGRVLRAAMVAVKN